jgi:hypothetical protein
MAGNASATVRTLWKRAPLWRSLIYLACLLSALVLFLPREVPQTTAPWQETASYVSPPKLHQSAAALPPAAPAAPVAPAAASAAPLAVSAAPIAVPTAPVAAPDSDTSAPLVSHPATVTNTPRDTDFTLAAPSRSLSANTNDGAPPVSGEVGKVYSRFYPLRGRNLPLRPGSWTVLAAIASKRPDADLENVLLGQIEGHQLKAAVLFLDFESFRGGWTSRFPGCTDRYNLASHVEDNGSQNRQACWFVRDVFAKAWKQWRDRDVKMDPIFRAAAGELEIKGVDYPQDLLEVFFHTADDRGALNAVYYFNPTDEGLESAPAATWVRSDWSADNISRFPQRLAYEKRLEASGSEWLPKIISVTALPRR